MESMMLTIKFVVFLALELFVLGALGAALMAGLHQIVRDKVRESRRLDRVTPKVHPATRHV
jgi:hypothetical protein